MADIALSGVMPCSAANLLIEANEFQSEKRSLIIAASMTFLALSGFIPRCFNAAYASVPCVKEGSEEAGAFLIIADNSSRVTP